MPLRFKHFALRRDKTKVTRNAANAATLKRRTSAATRKSAAVNKRGMTRRCADATRNGAKSTRKCARIMRSCAELTRNAAEMTRMCAKQKSPPKGELLMFGLLVSRSATSLHLHSEEEGIGLFTVLHFRRNGELHITILWRSSIHLHIFRTKRNAIAHQLLCAFNIEYLMKFATDALSSAALRFFRNEPSQNLTINPVLTIRLE